MISGSLDHPLALQSLSFALSMLPGFAVFMLLGAAALEQRLRNRASNPIGFHKRIVR